MTNYLDFEKPLAEIEGKANELRALARDNSEMEVEKEAAALDAKAKQMLGDLYKDLTPWRKCQVARHGEGVLRVPRDAEMQRLDPLKEQE